VKSVSRRPEYKLKRELDGMYMGESEKINEF
jgi:hypothetical protein